MRAQINRDPIIPPEKGGIGRIAEVLQTIGQQSKYARGEGLAELMSLKEQIVADMTPQ